MGAILVLCCVAGIAIMGFASQEKVQVSPDVKQEDTRSTGTNRCRAAFLKKLTGIAANDINNLDFDGFRFVDHRTGKHIALQHVHAVTMSSTETEASSARTVFRCEIRIEATVAGEQQRFIVVRQCTPAYLETMRESVRRFSELLPYAKIPEFEEIYGLFEDLDTENSKIAKGLKEVTKEQDRIEHELSAAERLAENLDANVQSNQSHYQRLMASGEDNRALIRSHKEKIKANEAVMDDLVWKLQHAGRQQEDTGTAGTILRLRNEAL